MLVYTHIIENHFNFFECSAKTGQNVDEAFVGTSRIILTQTEEKTVCDN